MCRWWAKLDRTLLSIMPRYDKQISGQLKFTLLPMTSSNMCYLSGFVCSSANNTIMKMFSTKCGKYKNVILPFIPVKTVIKDNSDFWIF